MTGKRGRPAHTPIDLVAVSFWVAHLIRASGVPDGRAFAQEMLKRGGLASAFARYQKGAYRPTFDKEAPLNSSNVGLAEEAVPGSACLLVSPVWDLIQGRVVSANRLAGWRIELIEEKAWIARYAKRSDRFLPTDECTFANAFRRLEALVALLHDARKVGDEATERQLLESFASLRGFFAKQLFCGGFEHSLLMPISDWVGELPSTDMPEPIATAASAVPKTEHTAEAAAPSANNQPISRFVRLSLLFTAIMLVMILGLADQGNARSVAFITLALLGCVVALYQSTAQYAGNARARSEPS